jgi:hypothetical protein
MISTLAADEASSAMALSFVFELGYLVWVRVTARSALWVSRSATAISGANPLETAKSTTAEPTPPAPQIINFFISQP